MSTTIFKDAKTGAVYGVEISQSKKPNTSDLKSFQYLENGEVRYSPLDTIKTEKKLQFGSYKLTYLNYPDDRVQLMMDVDEESSKSHTFPDKDKIDEIVNSFFNKNVVNRIKELGFYHKLGILLYGKEGTGKSTIIKHYYNFLIQNHQSIVFHITQHDYIEKIWDFILKIRKVQENPIIVILDEFDQFLPSKEAYLKTILDGNLSIDNCIFFASTNYLDKIPDALKTRPSRFKYVLNIEGVHSPNEIFVLMKNMLQGLFDDKEIRNFSEQIKGESLDTIKQFCLDKIMDIKSHIKSNKSRIGFIK